MKICTRCKASLPVTAFGTDKSRPDGLAYRCKECNRAYNREQCQRVPEKCREWAKNGQRAYRARNQGYESLDIDNSACEICGQLPGDSKNYLVTDHDHVSGKVRGVICRRCNLALGNFEDSIGLLEAAIGYLKRTAS